MKISESLQKKVDARRAFLASQGMKGGDEAPRLTEKDETAIDKALGVTSVKMGATPVPKVS